MHLDKHSISSFLIGNLRDNLFLFYKALDKIRMLFESFELDQTSQIWRIWPSKITVIAKEYRLIGIWKIDGGLTEKDRKPLILPKSKISMDLPIFEGPTSSEKIIALHYLDFYKWFLPLCANPEKVFLSSIYEWSAQLSKGIYIELGLEYNYSTANRTYSASIRSLTKIIQHFGKNWHVDLRYSNGIAIRSTYLLPILREMKNKVSES